MRKPRARPRSRAAAQPRDTSRPTGSTQGVRATARQVLAGPRPVSDECRKLLETLKGRCPGLIPPDPLPAGTVGPEIPLDRGVLQRLAVAAATGGGAASVLWSDADNELLVHVGKISVSLDRGVVLIGIPVRCDEVGNATIRVAFATGDEKRPAGLVCATEERPRGPAAIVDVWGEALVAFAWQVLLTVGRAIASQSGTDADGAELVPAALTTSPDGLRILTMARHTFDRVQR